MRSPLPSTLRDATTAPVQELVIPRGRRAVPTQTRLHTRRIPVAIYVAVSILVPALMVVGFMSAGLWDSTEGSSTIQTGSQGTNAGTPLVEGGEGDGGAVAPASPADVKGSMTVQQVVDAFSPITAAQILAELGAPLDTPTSTQLKTLVQEGSSKDIPALRTWLQVQAGS